MITKWRLNTRAVIRDGNLGRGADVLKGQDVILEVFSKGTVATGWEEVETKHTDEEGVSIDIVNLLPYLISNNCPSSQRETIRKHDEKKETEWVDRVEFRLSVGGQVESCFVCLEVPVFLKLIFVLLES